MNTPSYMKGWKARGSTEGAEKQPVTKEENEEEVVCWKPRRRRQDSGPFVADWSHGMRTEIQPLDF